MAVMQKTQALFKKGAPAKKGTQTTKKAGPKKFSFGGKPQVRWITTRVLMVIMWAFIR